MRAKPILLLGGACAVSVAAVFLVTELSAAPVPTTSEPPPALAAAPERYEAPTTEHRAPVLGGAAPLATPAAPAAVAATASSPRERELQLLASIDADLTERLRAERADPSWARETEAAIATTLGGAAFAGLRLEAVKCGASLCRVSLHASEQVADVDALVEDLTTTDAFRHGGFVNFTTPREVTMFVARKGHPLPPAPRT